MYAAITRFNVLPGKVEDAVHLIEESLPALQREPGHRGALFLTNDANEVVVIGLWESASDAEAWMTDSSAGAAQREQFRDLVAAPPTERTIYAVRVRDIV